MITTTSLRDRSTGQQSVTRLAWASLALFALCAPAQAVMLVDIQPGEWSEAMKSGHVLAAPPVLSEAAQQFYKTQIGMDMFGKGPIKEIQATQPTLTPDVRVGNPKKEQGPKGLDANGDPDPNPVFEALVMSWNNANNEDPSILNVASWDYNVQPRRDEEPNGARALAPVQTFDLTGAHIKFSLRAPRNIWDVSLELFDINGNSIGWFGQPPSSSWTNTQIWVSVFGPQRTFDFFAGDPNFDLTQVTRIRLNESTQGGRTAFDEIDPSTGLPGVWNAWNHLQVIVPEPGSLALLGLGVLAMFSAARRRR